MSDGVITQDHNALGHLMRVNLACVAASSDGLFPEATLSQGYEGRLLSLFSKPGTVAPAANYDITAHYVGSTYDLLEGCGRNRSAAAAEHVPIVFSGTSIHPVVSLDKARLVVAVTGSTENSATTNIDLYIGRGV